MPISNYYESPKDSIQDKVFSTLRKAIINGVYKPGERLIEEKIARELQISRTPVREAIKKLEALNLVQNQHNRGVVVKGLSEKEIMEICYVRILLESAAVELTAQSATSQLTNELNVITEEMKKNMLENNFDDYAKGNRKFHEILNSACGNERLYLTIQSLASLLRVVWDAIPSSMQNAQDSLREHELILQAVKNRDAIKAKELLSDHIRSVESKILQKIQDEELGQVEKLKQIFEHE